MGGSVVETFGMLVNPGVPLKPKITEITNITDMMLRDKPSAETAIPQLMDFIGDCAVAAHNASFDISMLRTELKRLNMSFQGPQIDTLSFARKLYPQLKSHRLGAVCKALGVSLKDAHRAVNDAAATAQCLARMMDAAREKGASNLLDLNGDSVNVFLLGLILQQEK
jgi:DNA polymerase-3 subunit alpha (Gram-positive type)